MALRFSYRISAEALNNSSVQPDRQSMDRQQRSQHANAEQPRCYTEESMQETQPSCIDLLTSF